MNPFILLAIGLLLIFLEFFLPGAVSGIAGGIFVLASAIIFAQETDSALALAAFIIGIFIALFALVKFALWRIKSSKHNQTFYQDKAQTGYVASTFDQSAIGKTGIVYTDLKPGGYITIDGKQHQAISISGYITKGAHVYVVGGQEESLIVKLSKKE